MFDAGVGDLQITSTADVTKVRDLFLLCRYTK